MSDDGNSQHTTRRQRKQHERSKLFNEALERDRQDMVNFSTTGASAETLVKQDLQDAHHARRKTGSERRVAKAAFVQQRALERRCNSQYREGNCVWNALLLGVAGLSPPLDASLTHEKLLGFIKERITSETIARRIDEVSFSANGEKMASLPASEVVATILNLKIGDGYLCTGCDPLLIAVCAVFGCSITHTFEKNGLMVFGGGTSSPGQSPRRVINLLSTPGHMMHVGNLD